MKELGVHVRKLLLDLSKIEGKIAETQHLIDYIPEDLVEFKKNIANLDILLHKYQSKKRKIGLKIAECDTLCDIEQERLDKAEKLLKLTKDSTTFNAAKKFENISRKVLTQLSYVTEHHAGNLSTADTAIAELSEKKSEIDREYEQGLKSLSLGHNNLERDLVDQRALEKELRLKFDKDVLQWFDPISSRNIRPVVVLVETTRCPACSGTFPGKVLQEMFSGVVHSCQNCRRLMVSFVPEDGAATTENKNP